MPFDQLFDSYEPASPYDDEDVLPEPDEDDLLVRHALDPYVNLGGGVSIRDLDRMLTDV